MKNLALALVLAGLAAAEGGVACGQQTPFELIKPSAADGRITQFDAVHVIARPEVMEGAPLAIFLPGTSGFPANVRRLLKAISDQGYRTIGLEYVDEPAVGQVCPKSADAECPAKFRAMRVYGEKAKSGADPVTNPEYDSIVARLTALLHELEKRHPEEKWGAYLLADGGLDWSKMVVSGLSQGAGMAAFIAKREKVLRVVCFSSPVDATGDAKHPFAPWLQWPSKTPVDRWYLVRNDREPLNPLLMKSYPLLGVPADHLHVFKLNLPAGMKDDPQSYHGDGVKNPAYLPEWKVLYGNAADVVKAAGQ